jgi:hypothetical protein
MAFGADPTVRDLLIWAADPSESAEQLQKAYDWRVAQWSALANTIATAVLGLFTSAFVESYKGTVAVPGFWEQLGYASMLFALSYLFCRLKIHILRKEFLALYTLLLEIS